MLPTLGVTELSIIAGLTFFLFGGKKMGELGKGAGQMVSGWRKGLKEPISFELEEPDEQEQ